MTIDELADEISVNLPRWQRNANLAFLRYTHSILREGGIWGWPSGMRVYRKAGDGFKLVEDLTADLLKVGDTVLWRDGWGLDPEQEAVVTEIMLTERGSPEDGEPVESIPWAFVNLTAPRSVAIMFSNGKWAYGSQVRKKE